MIAFTQLCHYYSINFSRLLCFNELDHAAQTLSSLVWSKYPSVHISKHVLGSCWIYCKRNISRASQPTKSVLLWLVSRSDCFPRRSKAFAIPSRSRWQSWHRPGVHGPRFHITLEYCSLDAHHSIFRPRKSPAGQQERHSKPTFQKTAPNYAHIIPLRTKGESHPFWHIILQSDPPSSFQSTWPAFAHGY